MTKETISETAALKALLSDDRRSSDFAPRCWVLLPTG